MSLIDELKECLNLSTIQLTPVSGGDINNTYKVKSADEQFFVKQNDVDFAFEMFDAERKGLNHLSKASGIKVPKPILIQKSKKGAFLVLKWVEEKGPAKDDWESFATQLAKMHQTKNNYFGLDHSNFIGKLEQVNTLTNKWIDFYYEFRIGRQLKLAIDSGKLDKNLHARCDKMFMLLSTEIPTEEPSLLHGDLWSGNLIFNQNHEAVFIDPAIYYGHREMDIAMMKLFGGFEMGFEFYQDLYPIEHNLKDRLSFYQLYYILVHVNLFGGNYIQSAKKIMEHYASRIS
jgi:protein-ribulosamine 3-kinase